ncbi:MAG: glycosyltransferase [Planctomycetota bacterium]
MPCSRADLHVHSKYSDRPSEWFLRRIGSPESFVEPLEIYERARARGMQFVTISDHNCIQGALEIAHLPDTFVSTEVTTYFPEDGCKIHCLVSGITERQFERIEELRSNIYEFRDYVLEEGIVYSVAHPFFRVNNKLELAHFEKLVLLFNRFEAINGTRDRRACDLAHAILSGLNPAHIQAFTDRHGIEPHGPTPWRKTFTGGSDDHSGRYIGQAHTETPEARNVDQFLDHLRRGHHRPGGEHGTSLLLAHCFYQIGYAYYSNRLAPNASPGSILVSELFRRLLDEPTVRGGFTLGKLGRRLTQIVGRVLPGRRARRLSEFDRTLVQEFGELLQTAEGNGTVDYAPGALQDRRTFELACKISHQVAYSFLRKLHGYLREGRLTDSLQSFAALGPVALGILPYLASFKTQHKDEEFLQRMAMAFPWTHERQLKSNRRAWVTDTFDDVNGVARTISTLGTLAGRAGMPLTVLTSLETTPEVPFDLLNFKPTGTFSVPEYEQQTLPFPPFLEILENIERAGYSELLISTPGPMGLVALTAANMFKLRAVGIYHTDFPEYVRRLTGDANLEQLTWRYMLWFYQQMDVIYVPSEATAKRLCRHGFDPDRLRVLGRGVDRERFDPAFRTDGFWRRFGGGEAFRFLYVGRVSREKNVEHLIESFLELSDRRAGSSLSIVGDGPALADLEERFRRRGVIFTGVLRGDDLARAFASSDVFVFPSLTDTYGNVVLEAHASGLPAIVMDEGGPPEIVRRFGSGLVVADGSRAALSAAMERMLDDRPLRRSLSERALAGARSCTWERVLEGIWSGQGTGAHPEAGPGEPTERWRSAVGVDRNEASPAVR